jgi:hypothetical protein
MKILEKVKNLKDSDSFIVTISILDGDKIQTNAESFNFPVKDIRVVKGEISKLLDRIYNNEYVYGNKAEEELRRAEENVKNTLQ